MKLFSSALLVLLLLLSRSPNAGAETWAEHYKNWSITSVRASAPEGNPTVPDADYVVTFIMGPSPQGKTMSFGATDAHLTYSQLQSLLQAMNYSRPDQLVNQTVPMDLPTPGCDGTSEEVFGVWLQQKLRSGAYQPPTQNDFDRRFFSSLSKGECPAFPDVDKCALSNLLSGLPKPSGWPRKLSSLTSQTVLVKPVSEDALHHELSAEVTIGQGPALPIELDLDDGTLLCESHSPLPPGTSRRGLPPAIRIGSEAAAARAASAR